MTLTSNVASSEPFKFPYLEDRETDQEERRSLLGKKAQERGKRPTTGSNGYFSMVKVKTPPKERSWSRLSAQRLSGIGLAHQCMLGGSPRRPCASVSGPPHDLAPIGETGKPKRAGQVSGQGHVDGLWEVRARGDPCCPGY